jgi:hypothetical protein
MTIYKESIKEREGVMSLAAQRASGTAVTHRATVVGTLSTSLIGSYTFI